MNSKYIFYITILYAVVRKNKDFHKKCDNKGPTVTLIKSEEEYIFGGYTSISWSNGYDICLDNNSFIFTLINMYNLNPIKFKPKSKGYICHSKYDGPNFGVEERLLRKIYDIRIGDDFKINYPIQNFQIFMRIFQVKENQFLLEKIMMEILK